MAIYKRWGQNIKRIMSRTQNYASSPPSKDEISNKLSKMNVNFDWSHMACKDEISGQLSKTDCISTGVKVWMLKPFQTT